MEYKQMFVKTYWDYYRAIERRLIKTEEFVAFNEVNNNAYSLEYLSLLQTICSEIDVVAKAIVSHYDSSFKEKNAGIKKWGFGIQHYLKGITTQTVVFKDEKRIIPWNNWSIEQRKNKDGKRYFAYCEGCGSPYWWKSYTDVKHARTTIDDGRVNYQKANQKNVINALAALYVMERMLLIKMDDNFYSMIDKSELFVLPGRNDDIVTNTVIDSKGKVSLVYKRVD